MKNGNGEWRAKKAIRLNIGLTEKEWAVLHKGLAIMHPCGQPRVDPLESVSSHQRNRIWALALLAVFKAVIRQGYMLLPLACDLRSETHEEMEERLRLEAAPDPERQPPEGPEGPPAKIDVGWLQQHFPGRWS
jgi:hypothetical protein